jgi:hypothetical protein
LRRIARFCRQKNFPAVENDHEKSFRVARRLLLLPHICAFVASLAAGTYLPKNFQKRLAKMKTDL